MPSKSRRVFQQNFPQSGHLGRRNWTSASTQHQASPVFTSASQRLCSNTVLKVTVFNIAIAPLPRINAIAQFFAHLKFTLNYHSISIAYLKHKSWKSSCRWFDSAPGHHFYKQTQQHSHRTVFTSCVAHSSHSFSCFCGWICRGDLLCWTQCLDSLC